MRVITIGIAMLLIAGAALASADEVTRDSYKEMVEPICKTNTEANEKILKGVKKLVQKGKLKPAGAAFLKASSALMKAYNQIKAVPQPPADTAKLTKWLSYVKTEATLFKQAGKDLKAGKKGPAQQIVVKLNHNATLANNEVLSFSFRYCKLNPSKFT